MAIEKLSSRTNIADNAITDQLLLHLAKIGSPNTSWKGKIQQIVPNYGGTCLFVSDNGNDTIAAVAPYMPFATKAAARAYALTLSPSATNRIRIIQLSGYSNEGIVLANYVDWDLGNSVIDVQAGSLAAIDDNNVACDSVIYGHAEIKRSTAGTNRYGVRTQNSGTNLTIYAKSITSLLDIGAYCFNGTQIINSKISYTGGSNLEGAKCSNGTQIITGNILSENGVAAWCEGGTQIINGNCTANNRTAVYCNNTGTQTINGDSYSFGANSAVWCNNGTQIINGDVHSNDYNAVYSTGGTQTINGDVFGNILNGAECNGGSQTINGNILCVNNISAECKAGSQIINNSIIVTTGIDKSAVSKSGGTLIIDGCTLIATGTGKGIDAPTAQNVLVYGACQSNKALHANITTQVGIITIDSNVQ